MGRECAALGHDRCAIASIDVGPLDGAVVQFDFTHVGPVDVAAFRIDDEAIRMPALGDNDLLIAAIRIDGEDSALAEVEHEQAAAGNLFAERTFRF